MLVAPATSLAAPSVTGEFDLPPATAVGSNNEITAGPDGNMWVTVDSENAIVRVKPDGTAERFDPAGMAHPATGIIAGPDGNLWAAVGTGVLRIPPANPNAADETSLGGAAGLQGITVGPDGNIWLAGTNVLVRVPPADPSTFKGFPDTDVGMPKGMTTASDGTMWIAGGDQVASATAADPPDVNKITVGGGTQDIAAGPSAPGRLRQPGRLASERGTDLRARRNAAEDRAPEHRPLRRRVRPGRRLLDLALSGQRPAAADHGRADHDARRVQRRRRAAQDHHRPRQHPVDDARPRRQDRARERGRRRRHHRRPRPAVAPAPPRRPRSTRPRSAR